MANLEFINEDGSPFCDSMFCKLKGANFKPLDLSSTSPVNAQKVIMDAMIEDLKAYRKCIDEAIKTIMSARFKCSTDEEIVQFAKSHKLDLMFAPNVPEGGYRFIGIANNNRWLYTLGGKTIGKKKGRWDFK